MADERFITLSSTTSTQDSGLFGYILPIFKAAAGIDVHVVAVGTGHALAIGMRGDADALLVHDRAGSALGPTMTKSLYITNWGG
jgi:tungstate transport system substrate-binding protein